MLTRKKNTSREKCWYFVSKQ